MRHPLSVLTKMPNQKNTEVPMNIKEFLEAIFGEWIDSQNLLNIFQLPERKTAQFSSIGSAAEYACSTVIIPGDVYCGTCLYGRVSKGRGKLEDVSMVPAMWADIDFGNTAHKNKSYAPDEESALKILNGTGLIPSVVVKSGNGLHGWWLLNEPLSPSEGMLLSKMWGTLIKSVAAVKGYTVDSVHDLSRVLRMPGTFNRKGSAPKLVTASAPERIPRYDYSDFEDLCDIGAAPATVTPMHVNITGKRVLTASKIELLKTNDPKFRKTWDRQRKDMADQSASSYDMALAHLGVQAELKDQEIADLIWEWRSKHSENPSKAERKDYVENTIAKARTAYISKLATGKAMEIMADFKTGTSCSTKQRVKLLRAVGVMVKIALVEWEQQGDGPAALYTAVLEDGKRVFMGSVQAVLSITQFRASIYSVTGSLVPNIKRTDWNIICEKLAMSRTVIPDEESDAMVSIWMWVRSYLQGKTISMDKKLSVTTRRPFTENGIVWISAPDLLDHVHYTLNQRSVSIRQLTYRLSSAGLVQQNMSVYVDKKTYTASFWKIKEKPNRHSD